MQAATNIVCVLCGVPGRYKHLLPENTDLISFEEPRIVQMHSLHMFEPRSLAAPAVTRPPQPDKYGESLRARCVRSVCYHQACAACCCRFRQWLLQQDPTQIDMRVAMASLLSTASASHVGKLSELLRKDVSFKAKKDEGNPVDLLRARIRDFVCDAVERRLRCGGGVIPNTALMRVSEPSQKQYQSKRRRNRSLLQREFPFAEKWERVLLPQALRFDGDGQSRAVTQRARSKALGGRLAQYFELEWQQSVTVNVGAVSAIMLSCRTGAGAEATQEPGPATPPRTSHHGSPAPSTGPPSRRVAQGPSLGAGVGMPAPLQRDPELVAPQPIEVLQLDLTSLAATMYVQKAGLMGNSQTQIAIDVKSVEAAITPGSIHVVKSMELVVFAWKKLYAAQHQDGGTDGDGQSQTLYVRPPPPRHPLAQSGAVGGVERCSYVACTAAQNDRARRCDVNGTVGGVGRVWLRRWRRAGTLRFTKGGSVARVADAAAGHAPPHGPQCSLFVCGLRQRAARARAQGIRQRRRVRGDAVCVQFDGVVPEPPAAAVPDRRLDIDARADPSVRPLDETSASPLAVSPSPAGLSAACPCPSC